MRIEKLRQTYDIEPVLVHFPLHPDTPAEVREMASWYRERGRDPEQMYQEMKARMDAEGLPYGRRTHSYNSRLAQELGKWADTQPGGGDPFVCEGLGSGCCAAGAGVLSLGTRWAELGLHHAMAARAAMAASVAVIFTVRP